MQPALLLNGYFARMSRAIAEHRGHVTKFIGDGILALFGALEPNPWQADDAVRAALAMREALDERFALQELPAAAVAGISEPVVTYAVEGVVPG